MLNRTAILKPPPPPRTSNSYIFLDYVSTHKKTINAGSTLKNTSDALHCLLCDKDFEKDREKHENHFNIHWRKWCALSEKDRNEKDSTCLDRINSTSAKLQLICHRNQKLSTSIQFRNTCKDSLKLMDFFLYNSASAVGLLPNAPKILGPGEQISLFNKAYGIGCVNKYVVRYTILPENTEFFEVHHLNQCCSSNGDTLQTVILHKDLEYMKSDVRNAIKYEVSGRLSPQNYVKTLTEFLRLEEDAVRLEANSSKCNIMLTRSTFKLLNTDPLTYSLKIPKYFPPVEKMDRFSMELSHNKKWRIQAVVTDIRLNSIIHITVDIAPELHVPYTIVLDDSQSQAELYALFTAKKLNFMDLLFPKTQPELCATNDRIESLEFFNDNIEKNPEQRQAVTAIVDGVSYPAPYLIFGPPGTGKTATVTEAILQLLRTKPESRILVTATSNAAADELTLRLLKYLRNGCYYDHNLYRLYAATVQRAVTDPQLLEETNSNFKLKRLPEWGILKKYSIIICTLTTAGRFMLEPPDGCGNPSVNRISNHFTHLFIDECGSATETASLVPIAVCASMGRINAHIILSGDPKQLGPVVQSKIAEKLGYGTSMIERLMDSEAYQRNAVTKKFCSRMLTQLLQNFRSHPDIINISNDLFYDGVLVPSAPIDKAHRFLGWSKLPIKQVPIIFDVTVGLGQKERTSTSWYNSKEVDKVVEYVDLLLTKGVNGVRISQDDIGIISPYKLQCQKIDMALQRCGRKIMIASVEMFQGKEKPVIIISTVRSGRQGIGFLDSAQRLNVLLTRAQALMILIGDPNVLQKDRNWYDVLKRLSNQQVMIGTSFVLASTRPPLNTHKSAAGDTNHFS